MLLFFVPRSGAIRRPLSDRRCEPRLGFAQSERWAHVVKGTGFKAQ
jgi:hypothetical protein